MIIIKTVNESNPVSTGSSDYDAMDFHLTTIIYMISCQNIIEKVIKSDVHFTKFIKIYPLKELASY